MTRVITAKCAICGAPVPGVELPLRYVPTCSTTCAWRWDARHPVPESRPKTRRKTQRKPEEKGPSLFDLDLSGAA
jgi:endogenous inhibitor of DNA gyrase (YacG/DUF329 family)